MDVEEETRDAVLELLANITEPGIRRIIESIFEADGFELRTRFRIREFTQELIVRREDVICHRVVENRTYAIVAQLRMSRFAKLDDRQSGKPGSKPPEAARTVAGGASASERPPVSMGK